MGYRRQVCAKQVGILNIEFYGQYDAWRVAIIDCQEEIGDRCAGVASRGCEGPHACTV